MSRLLSILLALLSLLPQNMDAQQESFMRVTVDDGLPHNTVRAIERDASGFVWIGTKNGLVRYDGRALFPLDCRDTATGHADNNIGALCSASDGTLWIGTDSGVFQYDPHQETVSSISLPTSDGISMTDWVSEIREDREGNIWTVIPNQGLFRLDKGSGKLDRMAFPVKSDTTGHPTCIDFTPDGTLWVATWGHGLFYLKPGSGKFGEVDKELSGYDFSDKEVNALTGIGYDLFIAMQNGELCTLDTHSMRSYPIGLGMNPGNRIRTLSADGKSLFVGTYEGLYIVDQATGKITRAGHNPFDPASIGDDIIYSLLNDNEGNLWVGTLFGGMAYLPAGGIGLNTISALPGTANSLSSDRIRGLDFDSQGNLWVGTEGAGINRIAPDGSMTRSGNPVWTVFRITHFGDSVYCGLYSEGLMVFDKEGNGRHYSSAELGISDPNVFVYLKDRAGNSWIGNGAGAWKAPAGSMRFTQVKEMEGKWVHDIRQDEKGDIWFATNGKGVWRLGSNGEYNGYTSSDSQSGLRSDRATSLFIDSKGSLWVSTDHGGVARHEKGTDRFTTYSIEEGLPDDVAYDILEDHEGNIWFGTDKGLVCLDPASGNVRSYDRSYGLRGNGFNYSSAAKGDDGKLYFGGATGIVAVNPDTPAPREDAKVYFLGIPSTHLLTVPKSDSNISITLSMPLFRGGASIRFEYMLLPVDKDWHPVMGNVLNLAGLAAGRYTLKVRGTASDGRVGANELSIRVTPPWYASWWALTLYILLETALVAAAVYWYKDIKEWILKRMTAIVQGRLKRRMVDIEPYLSIAPVEGEMEAAREFREKFLQVVDAHMAEEDFNVEKIADMLCMSRSALFRKIKQTFGLAPVALLRSIRLKKAAELIATGRYRVGQVGQMVGIASASYFNNQFQKQFGMTPKEYENQCRTPQPDPSKERLPVGEEI